MLVLATANTELYPSKFMSKILMSTIGLKNINKKHNIYFLVRLKSFLIFKYNPPKSFLFAYHYNTE